MTSFDLIVNKEFSSNSIDKKLFSLKVVRVLFQYPSVYITEAANELAKTLPLFKQIESFSLTINSYCVIHNKGYTKITQNLKNLKQLRIFSLQIGSNCLFDKNIIHQFKTSLQNLDNLEEIVIKIDHENQFLENCLKWIGQIFHKTKNLQKLNLEILESKCITNKQFIQFCNGLSNLQNLKVLSLNLDFSNLNNNSSIFFEKAFQELKNLDSLTLIVTNFKQQRFKNIFKTFKYLTNLKKFILCLDCESQLTDDIMQEFTENIQHLTNLKEIQLKGKIFETSRKLLFSNLFMNMNGLEKCVLELPFKNKGELEKLGQSISNLKNLKEFSIKSNNSLNNNEQFNIFTSIFGELPNLQSLELCIYDLKFKSIELESLRDSLNKLLNITQLKLNLNYDDSDQKGLILFYEGLSNLKSLINLELCICLIQQQNPQFNRDFGQVLVNLLNLQKLKFSFDGDIKDEEIKSIESGIGQLINLEHLELQMSSNNNSIEFSNKIYESVYHLSQLRTLQLNNIFLKNKDIPFNMIQNQKQNYQLMQPQNKSTNDLEKYNNKLPLSVNICKLKYFINLIELDLNVILQNKKSKELVDLGESFKKMKNLNNLRLQINSKNLNYEVQQRSLISFADGLQNLINLQFVTLKFDFKNNTREDKIYQKIFQNLSMLLQIDITLENLTKDVLFDLKEGMKQQNQLESLIFQKIIFNDSECIDYLAELIRFVPNLKWLCFKEYPSKLGSDKLLSSINSLKNLISFEITEASQDQKIETANINEIGVDQLYNTIKKQISNQINQQVVNEIIKHKTKFQDKLEHFNVYNGLQSHEYNITDKSMDDPVIIDKSNFIFLQKLIIRFRTWNPYQFDDKQLYHVISSFKFLVEFRIDTCRNEQNYWDGCPTFYKRPIQLNISQINAIGKALLNLRCLEKLQLKLKSPYTISNRETKLQLSNEIGKLKNLKHLILHLDEFDEEHLKEFNSNIAFKNLQKLNKLNIKFSKQSFKDELYFDYTNCFIGLKFLINLTELQIKIKHNQHIGNQVSKMISDGISQMTNLDQLKIRIDWGNDLGIILILHRYDIYNINNKFLLKINSKIYKKDKVTNIYLQYFNILLKGNEEVLAILGLESYLKKLNRLKTYKIKIQEYITSDILTSFSNFQNYQIDNVQVHLNLKNNGSSDELHNQYMNVLNILNPENEFKVCINNYLIRLKGQNHKTKSCYKFNFKIDDDENQFLYILSPLYQKQNIKVLSLDINAHSNKQINNSLLHISEKLINIKQLDIKNISYYTNLHGDFLQRLQQLQKLTFSFQTQKYCLEFLETLPKLQNLEYIKADFNFEFNEIFGYTQSDKLNLIQKSLIQMDKLKNIILYFQKANYSKNVLFKGIVQYIKRLVSFDINYKYQ